MLNSLKQLANRPTGIASSIRGPRTTTNILRRSYAEQGATSKDGPAATNIRDSPYSGGEASGVDARRSLDSEQRVSKSTTARPVTNPEETGSGRQEESKPSQENMKRPKEEPDGMKRQHVEAEGQKPLDPADDGYGITSKDRSQ
ncbi:hypothetical protein DOTSEDRAFT_69491 [Dothistroma septosporum NZE10]|uniref:Uncharacterized protein n=1 Tax=Dothistroma septosporum (strain NZE10 / CBS 128990) TaxID=675120 RepID=N1PVQ2_DOTSN|nr:hypothetical protein DOTSEDRAFT_69491 [Dothistroma septosporum NZE10]